MKKVAKPVPYATPKYFLNGEEQKGRANVSGEKVARDKGEKPPRIEKQNLIGTRG